MADNNTNDQTQMPPDNGDIGAGGRPEDSVLNTPPKSQTPSSSEAAADTDPGASDTSDTDNTNSDNDGSQAADKNQQPAESNNQQAAPQAENRATEQAAKLWNETPGMSMAERVPINGAVGVGAGIGRARKKLEKKV